MESFAEGEDFVAPCRERRELESVFIGLGARIAEEKLIVGVARYLAETGGKPLLKRILHRV